MNTIYVVDDDEKLCEILRLQLSKEGFKVQTFTTAEGLLLEFDKKPSDLIISDVMMPEINGYDLLKVIRQKSDVPFILLTAKDEEIDKLLGLELGSDDYITKPFSLREVTIRVRNMLRRYSTHEDLSVHSIRHKDLWLDFDSRQIKIHGELVDFTTKEFDVIKYFMDHMNQALSREQLIDALWDYEFYGDSRQVDHTIKRIRKKLIEKNAEFTIDTVWGYGYKVMSDEN